MSRQLSLYVVHAVLCLLLLSSCVRHRQLISFRESDEAPTIDGYVSQIKLPELLVQPDDILYIRVSSFNEAAAMPYNLTTGNQNIGGGGGGQNTFLLLQGYTVDSSGYIDFPNVGLLEVEGLALEGVRQKVVNELRSVLPDAVVNVKFLNFRYTLLGDVLAPGTYSTVNERVSLLEALGTAGDLTPYADRQNVYVIRELDGRRTITQLNLQSVEFLSSDYYYLRQNDVVYVEPNEARVATVADPVGRFVSYGSAFLGIVSLVLTLVLRN